MNDKYEKLLKPKEFCELIEFGYRTFRQWSMGIATLDKNIYKTETIVEAVEDLALAHLIIQIIKNCDKVLSSYLLKNVVLSIQHDSHVGISLNNSI